jgi:hypothetical protein
VRRGKEVGFYVVQDSEGKQGRIKRHQTQRGNAPVQKCKDIGYVPLSNTMSCSETSNSSLVIALCIAGEQWLLS